MLQIKNDVNLHKYSTMRLGGTARHLCMAKTPLEIAEACEWASRQDLPVIMVGGGSNIIWRDEGFAGLVIVNAIRGYDDYAEDEINHFVTVGAGENWDEIVARTVKAGLTGIEALSLIPGTAGATPIQNVGAYGQDISQTLVHVDVFDTKSGSNLTIVAADCQFGYRSSRFNRTDRGRYFITSLTLHLKKQLPQPPFYNALQQYFDEHHITEHDPATIRQAVIAIRSAKLPDPALVANNGSFFANPVISQDLLKRIQSEYPAIPNWPTSQPGQIKIPAAWLIEQVGFKDHHDAATGMATWPTQPLVLVNEAAGSLADLITFRDKITMAVADKFGIELTQEPEILP